MSRSVRVTLCMITKNEEKNIACCINSVRHLIDEIVVVDTGSTDSTINQALQAGAMVFDYNWQHNFAEARNYGLDQANGDWILVLDADEMLEYVDAGIFNKLLVHSQAEGYFIDIESYIGNGEEKIFDRVVRLFRNRPNYRFTGAIHEQVAGTIKAVNHGQGLACAGLKIIHRGYLDETIQAKNKHTRNMDVINRALVANPDNPFLLYSLGIEYIQQGEVVKANEQLINALQYLTGGEGYFRNVVLTLASGLLQTGQLFQAKELINKAFAMLPPDGDLLLFKGIVTLADDDYAVAVELLQQSLAGIKDNTLVSSIHALCGDIYSTLKYYDRAELEYFTSLQIVPQHLYPLLQLIGIKQKGESRLGWQQVSQFTSQSINKDLQLELIRMKELSIVLVLALLNIINSGSQQALITTCDDYLTAVMLYQPVDELSQITIDYLKVSAKLMILYARTGINCALLPANQKINNIIYNNLDLIIKTLCPTWIPCTSLNKIIADGNKRKPQWHE